MSKTSTDKKGKKTKPKNQECATVSNFDNYTYQSRLAEGKVFGKEKLDFMITALKLIGYVLYDYGQNGSTSLIFSIAIDGFNNSHCPLCEKVHDMYLGVGGGSFIINCHVKVDNEYNVTYYCFESGKSIILYDSMSHAYYHPKKSNFTTMNRPTQFIEYCLSYTPVRIGVMKWTPFTPDELLNIENNVYDNVPHPMMNKYYFRSDPKNLYEVNIHVKEGVKIPYACPLCCENHTDIMHDVDRITKDRKFPGLVLVKKNVRENKNHLVMLCKYKNIQVAVGGFTLPEPEPEKEESESEEEAEDESEDEQEDEPGSVPEPEKKKKQKIIVFDNSVKVLGIRMEGPKFTDFSKSTKTIKDLLKLETQLEEEIDKDTVIKITELMRNVMTRVGANKGYVIARNINGEYQSYKSSELSDLLGRRVLSYQPSKKDANPIKTSLYRLATDNRVLETNFKGFTCDLYLPGITKPPKYQKEGYLNSYVPIKRKYISKDIRDTSDENLFIRLIQYVICGDADPKLMKELYHYTDTAEQYSTLYEIFCYTLAYIRSPAQSLANGKHTNTKKMLIMHEPKGGAGKSAISTSIQAIFGDSLTTIEPHIGTLTGTHSNFSGKVYIFVDDCEKGTTPNTKVAVSQLKSTITSEAITVNPKGIQSYKVPYYGNIVLLTNTTKLFDSPDSALQRRTLVIPCTKAESEESKIFFKKIYGILEGEKGRLEEFCDNVYSWFLDYNEEFDDIDFNDNVKFPIPTSQASNDMFAIADGTIGLYFNLLKKGKRFTHEQVEYDGVKNPDKIVHVSKIKEVKTYVIRPPDLYKDYKEYCEDRERKMRPEPETKFYASKEYIENTTGHSSRILGKMVVVRILHKVVCKKGKCDCKCRIHYIPDKPEEEYEEESEEDHSEKVERHTVKEKKRKFVEVD